MLFNDNIYLGHANPVSTWGGSVTPMLNLRMRTPSSATNIGGRWIFNKYSEESVRNNDTRMLTASGYKRASKSRFNWRGLYKSDTTISTITVIDDVIDEEGTETTDSDTGIVDLNLVAIDIRRNQLRLRPSWSLDLTRRTSLRIGYQMTDVNYSGAAGILSDYRTHGVDFGVFNQFNRTTSVGANISATSYKAADDDSESEAYGLMLSLDHTYSPKLRGSLSIGARSATISSDNVDTDSTGFIANASLARMHSDLTSYSISLERGVRPSGARTVVISDILRADFTHALSRLLSLSIRSTAFRNKSLDRSRTSSDRMFISVEAGFVRMLTRFWKVEGSYQYRRQEYDNDDFASDGNSVSLSVSYDWPRISASR